jgi:hypothetical protein
MVQLTQFLQDVLNFFREGFAQVNAVEGLVIALIATLVASAWNRVWSVAVGATVVHLIANALIPVIANHATFRLPAIMEMPYWRTALSLFAGYLVVIAVFMFIKRMFLSPAHAL